MEFEGELRARSGEQYVCNRQIAIAECSTFFLGSDLKYGDFFVGSNEKNLFSADPRVSKELVRMRTDKKLARLEVLETLPLHSADLFLQFYEKLRELAHDLRVEGELRFLQEEWTFAFEHRPQQTEEA